jgi:hypothetical protein
MHALRTYHDSMRTMRKSMASSAESNTLGTEGPVVTTPNFSKEKTHYIDFRQAVTNSLVSDMRSLELTT